MASSFALQYSYYQIYCSGETGAPGHRQENTDEGARPEEIGDDVKEVVVAAAAHNGPSAAVWTPDAWTTAEEQAAQIVLENHADKCQISVAQRRRLPTDTQAWDRFYQQHQTNFFKDRHYLTEAFPDEFTSSQPHTQRTLVEIGCGVGNTLLPLLEDDSVPDEKVLRRPHGPIQWTVYGVDLSAVAIDLLQQEERFVRYSRMDPPRAWAGVADLVHDGLPAVCHGQAHVATLLFCLSAIAPEHHARAAHQAIQALRPDGGVLVLRDYGRYDQAELQLAVQRGKRLAPGYYVKHDSTKCYYFTTQDLRRLFVEELGLEELENGYIQRQYINRGDGTRRRRVWVQARFRRRPDTAAPTNG